MRSLDRAVCAIFLLVLLADVARVHASVPVAGEAGMILSAASQLQAGSAEAAPAPGRGRQHTSPGAAFSRLGLAGWSRNIFHFSGAVLQPELIAVVHAEAGLCLLPEHSLSAAGRPILEHAGSPAP